MAVRNITLDMLAELYTPAEVAMLLRVSVRTVKRWADIGKLAHIKLPGSGYRFRKDVIDDILSGGVA